MVAAIVLTALVGGFTYLYWRQIEPFLPGARRPFLPPEDRPPLASGITFADIEEYVAEGMRGLRIHLMQAARRWDA